MRDAQSGALPKALNKKSFRAFGITQEDLATQIRMSYQQLRKHEKGKNPISAARLFHIAEALRTPIEDFMPAPEPFTTKRPE